MRYCQKCHNILNFIILVEDPEEGVFKNFYYCNTCNEYTFKLSEFTNSIVYK